MLSLCAFPFVLNNEYPLEKDGDHFAKIIKISKETNKQRNKETKKQINKETKKQRNKETKKQRNPRGPPFKYKRKINF